METLNVVDATQPQVVDGQETPLNEVQAPAVEEQENPVNAGQEEVEAPHKQKPTIEESKAIAEQRRKAEYAEKQAREAAEKLQKTEQLLKSFGFEGQTVDDLLVQGFAHAKGMTAEQYKAEQEIIAQEAQRRLQSDPQIMQMNEELERYRLMEFERVKSDDLKVIQEVDPKIKSVDELGEKFFRLRANGIDTLTAYHAIKQAAPKKVVAQMGDISASSAIEKDFFTREEVARMSQSEVDKNFETIKKSMTKWK